MYSLDPSLVPRLFHKESGNKSRNEAIWPPYPSGHARKIFRPCEEGSFGHARKGLGNNLARKCRAGMAQFFNPANFLFRSSTQVLFQFSKFLCSIYCFLSLVGWLADVAFSLSSTPTATFQHSKHSTQASYYLDRYSPGQKGLGYRLQPHHDIFLVVDQQEASLCWRGSAVLPFPVWGRVCSRGHPSQLQPDMLLSPSLVHF